MKFEFSWKEQFEGKIEIDAKNGNEAERIFNELTLKEKIDGSSPKSVDETKEIKFVDFAWVDNLTYEEWISEWSISDNEWEEWEKRFFHVNTF